jgi:amidase
VLSDVGMAVVEDCPPGLAEMMEIADVLWRANREAEQCGIFREFLEGKPMWPVDIRRYTDLWLKRAQEAQSDDFMSAAEFLAWTWKWDLYRGKMLEFLERYDVILCPVDPYPALPHGTTMHDDFPPQGVTAYTKPYSMAGWPSAVVRAGTSPEGLPIGVQVVAGPWREDVALAVAQHVEMALGGWERPPL